MKNLLLHLYPLLVTWLLLLGLSALPAHAEDMSPVGHCVYVSPQGKHDGDGTKEKPLDLPTAFSGKGAVNPGDTLLLGQGSYEGPIIENTIERLPFVLLCSGTPEKPIRIMPAPGESAHLNGTLSIRGSYLCLVGLEIGDLTWDLYEGKRKNGKGVFIEGPSVGVRLINCNVFGGWNGITAMAPGNDTEFYGCLVHDFGNFKAEHTPGGSSFYTQNASTAHRLISNCAAYRSGGLNMAPHGQGGSVQGYDITQNILFLAGGAAPKNSYENLMINTSAVMNDITVIGNVIYQHEIVKPHKANVRISNYSKPVLNKSAVFKDNYVLGGSNGLRVGPWESFVATGNTIWAQNTLTEISSSTIGDGIPAQPAKPDLSKYTFKNNTYFGQPDDLRFRYSNNEKDKTIDNYSFAQWQQLGLDTDSKLLPLKNGKPTGTRVFVFPNKYQAGRANIAVVNYDGLSACDVDLSGVLKKGDKFVVYHLLDIHQTIALAKPTLTGTFDGGTVKFPAKKDDSAPEFEAYLVLPVIDAENHAR